MIGCRPYEWIAKNENKPIVIAGFEPPDILQTIVMLLEQLRKGECKVENQHKRVVPWEGNRAALKAMSEVFELQLLRMARHGIHLAIRPAPPRHLWRVGRGTPFLPAGHARQGPQSGAMRRVLKGVLKPVQCKLFGNECSRSVPSARRWCRQKHHARLITTKSIAKH